MTVGVPGWIRANLFSSPTDGIITIVLGAIIALAIFQSINWVFFTASWEAVTSRVPLYVIGRYPQDLYWRPLTTLMLVGVLLGIAWRLWGGMARGAAIVLIVVTLLAGALPYAGVDLGAPTHDPNIEIESSTPQNLREKQRDVSDADPANAVELKVSDLSGTRYELATLDGIDDRADYYTFTLEDDAKKFGIGLWQLESNADLTLESEPNRTVASSNASGTSDEFIETTLDPGTYYVRVDSAQTGDNEYVLSYSATDPPDHLVNVLFIINFLAVALGYFAAAIPPSDAPELSSSPRQHSSFSAHSWSSVPHTYPV